MSSTSYSSRIVRHVFRAPALSSAMQECADHLKLNDDPVNIEVKINPDQGNLAADLMWEVELTYFVPER
jgi:hypothetical protein